MIMIREALLAPPAAEPQPKSILLHLALKRDIWRQQFELVSWESTDKTWYSLHC